MATSPSDRFYEIVRIAPSPEDPHYVQGCTADLYFPVFGDVDLDRVAALGSMHVLLDVDGTLTATSGRISVDPRTKQKLQEIAKDPRFETLSLATENRAHAEDLLHNLGVATTSLVFQPWEAGSLGTSWKTTERFWKKILFELDCFDEPHKAVLIGDSLVRDIQPAQAAGMKTVLVDRIERRLRPRDSISFN